MLDMLHISVHLMLSVHFSFPQSLNKHLVSAGVRQKGVSAEEESSACRGGKQCLQRCLQWEVCPGCPWGPAGHWLAWRERPSIADVTALSSSAKGMGWHCCPLYKIPLIPTEGFLLPHECALAEVTAVLKCYSADERSFIRIIKQWGKWSLTY